MKLFHVYYLSSKGFNCGIDVEAIDEQDAVKKVKNHFELGGLREIFKIVEL